MGMRLPTRFNETVKALTDFLFTAAHRGAFYQFLFQWIYYYGSNKSTGKETGKTHLCALVGRRIIQVQTFVVLSYDIGIGREEYRSPRLEAAVHQRPMMTMMRGHLA